MIHLKTNKLFFGLKGLNTKGKTHEFNIPLREDLGDGKIKITKFRPKKPGDVFLKDKEVSFQQPLLGMVYGFVDHQLEITLPDSKIEKDNFRPLVGLIQIFIDILRISSHQEIEVVAVVDSPWGRLEREKDNSVFYRNIGRYPLYSLKMDSKGFIDRKMINYSVKNINYFIDLLKNEEFKFAVDSFVEFDRSSNLRLAVASLWSGIESLFKAQQETTFLLSLQVASLLQKPGDSRQELFKKIQKMYGLRSRLIHGEKVSHAKIVSHLGETKELLAELLKRIIDLKKIPTRDELLLLQNIKFN